MISAVKHAASIRNPEFDARQRARRSTWDTPRFLYSYDETAQGDLVPPRGLHDLLTELVDSADSTLRSDDQRVVGDHHQFTCATPLRTTQYAALQQLLNGDTGVLIAPPGTGKTVIACAAVESRATSTLVLVDRRALADQWRDRIGKHLGFTCGQIGGGWSKTTGILDIALPPTIACRDTTGEITANYGFVIVDECHHVAASAFLHVLSRIPARYWLGLTATPERRDGLEDLIYHQLGSHHVIIDNPGTGQLPVDGSDLLTPQPCFTCIRPDSDTPATSTPVHRAEWRRSTAPSRGSKPARPGRRRCPDRGERRGEHPGAHHMGGAPQCHRRTATNGGQGSHRPQRAIKAGTAPDIRPACQPHTRVRSATDRRYQLIHRGLIVGVQTEVPRRGPVMVLVSCPARRRRSLRPRSSSTARSTTPRISRRRTSRHV